ncbi:MAG TPA: glycosyltransferase family 39 protein [Chitinophagaceae bacterium]|nr:glycosyltransferase family 39 protein [Chitinophagaceae bacterium]
MPTVSFHKPLYYLIGLAVLVNFSGLFVPLMDPDAGVYASISKSMVQQNDYVNLFFQDTDWLDKPHFPFWITAVFFKIFGFHDWAYKIPGILFVMMGARYTYLFARKYYNETIALWSAFILLTSLHIIISNNDVRAEPYLTGLIIAAVYHFSNSLNKGFGWQLIAACLFSACAVMTKGIFTLIPIGGAIAGELMIKKNWKQLFHWRWLVALVLIIVFISPELYCLWKQFDQHPEKTVLGTQNVSGIKFFLWDSQFGRFFNTGPIKGKGDKLFFVHTLLWAFLPWSLLLYAALFAKIRGGIKKTRTNYNEWFTISGSLLTLLVFSFSSFQLPHYANILFPMLAILCAHFIWQQVEANKKVFGAIQDILAVLLLILVVGLALFYRPYFTWFTITALAVMILLVFLVGAIIKHKTPYTPYMRSGFAILVAGLFLNLSFYRDLLRYQSGNAAAAYLNKYHPGTELGRIGIYFPAGEFYLKQHTYRTDTSSISNGSFPRTRMLFVTSEELKQLQEKAVALDIVKEFKEFHVTMLSLKFLNPKTREKELKDQYLIRLL